MRTSTKLALFTNYKYSLELLYLDRRSCHKKRVLRFNINNLTRNECLQKFRFDRDDLNEIRLLLNIPDTIRCGNHARRCTGIEALSILLRRLVYPNRLCELEKEFGRYVPDLSNIINFMLRHIHNSFRDKLESLELPWFDLEHLSLCADAISRKGATLERCWGFLDGTVRSICRPKGHFHRAVYNGHKRTHALKFQTIVTSNGLIANIFGGVEGRRHDTFLLHESKLLEKLKQLRDENNEQFYLYADQEYPLSTKIIVPFCGGQTLPQQQRDFNETMSRLRLSVEWPYSKIIRLFAFVDFKKNQKLFSQPISLYYLIATFFSDIHVYLQQSGC